MNTRSLAARLKRLEFRPAPDYQPPTFEICAVDSKGEILYRMRLGQPENQYFAPDGKPITKDEANRFSSALGDGGPATRALHRALPRLEDRFDIAAQLATDIHE
jgi:hypothetical protein